MDVTNFSSIPQDVHYTTRSYGPAAPWPADRPATFVPIALHTTRYARDAIGPVPRDVMVYPRGQRVPARALGGYGVWMPRYAAPQPLGLAGLGTKDPASRVDPSEVKEFKTDALDAFGGMMKDQPFFTTIVFMSLTAVVISGLRVLGGWTR